MILDSFLKVCFVMLENFCTFVMLFKPQRRGNLPIYDRHFLCPVLSIYGGFVPPCWSVNAPTAFVVKSNGTGEAAVLFYLKLNLLICILIVICFFLLF